MLYFDPLEVDISSPSCLLVSAGNSSEVSQIFFGNFDKCCLNLYVPFKITLIFSFEVKMFVLHVTCISGREVLAPDSPEDLPETKQCPVEKETTTVPER